MFGILKVSIDIVFRLQHRVDVGNLFDKRQFEYALSVVGHRSVRIHGDGHRPHSEESERNQPKCKDRFGRHQISEALSRYSVRNSHEANDPSAYP